MQTLPEQTTISPSVLYFGTPVVLVSTLNPDGSPNLSAMSSAWALGNRIVLGMGSGGRGIENLERTRECVLNFPSAALWTQVERLAPTTGVADVPRHKQAGGYVFEADKFGRAGLTPIASEIVSPPRAAECPIQIEASVVAVHVPVAVTGDPDGFRIVETRLERFHAHSRIVIPDSDQIDTEHWQPLLYVFRHYFGTGARLGRNFRAET